jgi:phosphoribosylglycinamide formyltransferase 2
VLGESASAVVLARGQSQNLRYTGVAAALDCDDVQLRLFAKPAIDGQRRLGVALARAPTTAAAVAKAKTAAAAVKVIF